MTDHNLDFQIAETLEKVQHINPELYGYWYSKLYPPHGDLNHWNVNTLEELKQVIDENTCFGVNMNDQQLNELDAYLDTL